MELAFAGFGRCASPGWVNGALHGVQRMGGMGRRAREVLARPAVASIVSRPLKNARHLAGVVAAWSVFSVLSVGIPAAEEPPALNPFGKVGVEREDQFPGYIEMSDGSIHCGMIYLTRDKRLQINDEKMQRQREIPLNVVQQIECKVKREWMEKEWKFKELAKDEKMYTGRSYPAREYEHVVTLQDGRKIEGGLSGVVYLQPQIYDPKRPNEYRPAVEAQKFLLHKRDKGEVGEELKSLKYVKIIKLGEEAYREGQQKSKNRPAPAKPSR